MREIEDAKKEEKKIAKREAERDKKRKQRAQKRIESLPGTSATTAIDVSDSDGSDDEAAAVEAAREAEQVRMYAIKQENAKYSSSGATTEKNRVNVAKKKGIDPSTMKRHTNWQHWAFWTKIKRTQEALRDVWSADKLVNELHKTDPELFAGPGGLTKGVVHKWFARDAKRKVIPGWSEATLRRVEASRRPGPISRSKVLVCTLLSRNGWRIAHRIHRTSIQTSSKLSSVSFKLYVPLDFQYKGPSFVWFFVHT
ncbi:hypothetical protein PENSPDRAFT_311577 [Peniophora sp. CONT]|nr:hypothetical protein PENSPDRAFT_311577 [Peniophora sp. CONT]